MAPMPITDAVFLMSEKREQPTHVGALQLFQLPAGAGSDWIRETYDQIIHDREVAPMFQRRPVRPASSLGAWSWQLDHDVDIEHHVRHSALPQPGRVRELLALVSRLHQSLLDRHRPLWEAHIIEGLDGSQFATYFKIHHSLMDGVSALRLLESALDPDPDARNLAMPWATQPPPKSPGPAGIQSLLGLPRQALKATGEVAALAPRATRGAIRALIDQSTYLPSVAPKTIFNVAITGARRYAAQSWPLDEIKAVGKATGTTINDVVLAMSSSALRAYLDELGALPDAPLVAMTPVSLREAGSDYGGNAVGSILCNLATDLADAGKRLEGVHDSMERAKTSIRGMTPTQVALASAANVLPMAFSTVRGLRNIASPAFNVTISNVPGPKEALYWNGALLDSIYPVSVPTDGQALNITVTSYHGKMQFGLIGCRRNVPHLQKLLTYLDEGLNDLKIAAGLQSPSRHKRRS